MIRNILLLLPLLWCFWGPLASAAEQVTFGCNIVDLKGTLLRRLPGGRCNFLSDGRFASSSQQGLRFYGADGAALWRKLINCHHATHVYDEKELILVLHSSFHDLNGARTRFDKISLFNFAGQELRSFDFYAHRKQLVRLADQPFRDYRGETYIALQKPPEHLNEEEKKKFVATSQEFSHANSVRIIPENTLTKHMPAFAAGNFLVNVNGLNLVLVLDAKMKKILWASSHAKLLSIPPGDPNLYTSLHDLQLLPNGKLLIYNNNYRVDSSAIEQLDLVTKKREVIYTAKAPEKFFGRIEGTVQKLSEDRFVIAEVNPGVTPPRIFEVNREGKISWSLLAREGGPTGTPADGLLDARVLPLAEFLKNNQMGK